MGNDKSKMEAKESQEESVSDNVTDISKIFDEMRKLQTKPKNVLTAERTNILRTAFPYFKAQDSELSLIEVVMTTDGVKEDALDLGGPTREFFTIFFKEILRKNIDMFEGQDRGHNLFPVNNDGALSNGLFGLLGKAIVISLLSRGPGFPYLAPCVVSYLRGQDYLHQLNIGMVYNTILRQFIKKLNNCESEERLLEILENDNERYIDNCGWPRYQMITLENRLELTQTLLKWELIGRRVAALEQLKSGLNTLGFLDRTRGMAEVDQYLLNHDTEKSTADYLKSSLRAQLENLKVRNEKEEQAKHFTMSCMEMMTDKEATSLFQFITGMSALPVDGIPIEVEFNTVNKKAELPEAITCIQRLRIPLGNESQMAFYSSFHKALSMGKYGFGESQSLLNTS